MAQSESESNLPNWEWHPCIYDIQQTFSDRDHYWNLSPYFMISDSKEDVKNFIISRIKKLS